MKVTVRYVDGSERTIVPADWPYVRSDGIDYVDVHSGVNADRIQGHGLYWLYRDGERWVVGGADMGEGARPPSEVVVAADGGRQYRHLGSVPDLEHHQVKLGWWLPEDGD